MIELNYTNINKAMNISVQSVFHGGERGKKNFTEGNRRLPIFYNNGDTGATSPRPITIKTAKIIFLNVLILRRRKSAPGRVLALLPDGSGFYIRLKI